MAGEAALVAGTMGGSGCAVANDAALSSVICGVGYPSGLFSTAAKLVIAARSICLRQV